MSEMEDRLLAMERAVQLTPEELDVILRIADRVGKDRDGDILRFFVKSDANLTSIMQY